MAVCPVIAIFPLCRRDRRPCHRDRPPLSPRPALLSPRPALLSPRSALLSSRPAPRCHLDRQGEISFGHHQPREGGILDNTRFLAIARNDSGGRHLGPRPTGNNEVSRFARNDMKDKVELPWYDRAVGSARIAAEPGGDQGQELIGAGAVVPGYCLDKL